jgi:Secretion system C-terminal sorting domain
MKILCITLLLTFSSIGYSQTQIDTTEYFPLQIGNHWEYILYDMGGNQYTFYTVIGDTLMSNGKQYKFVKTTFPGTSDYNYNFYRNDGNLQYKYFKDSIICPDQEYIIYNFTSPDSTIWPICYSFMGANLLTCFKTFNEYLPIFNQVVQTKEYLFVSINNKDTIWGPGFTGVTHVSKNIGVTFEGYEGSIFLSGAILNGVTYGEIVGIKDKYFSSNDFKLYQNFPNPFNPSTNIKFEVKEQSLVNLKVYDILGNIVADLINEEKHPGRYSATFNGDKLSSGIYFYKLTTGSKTQVKKMILIR